MRRWLALVAAFFVALAGALPANAQERRLALIIANEAYVSPGLGRLPGTKGDAAVMSNALRQAGFEVRVASDLGRLQMVDALSAFARDLQEAGPNGVGFLYYSGHGMADSPRGKNYLIPVDATIRATTDLPVVALSLDSQLEAIELAGAGGTIIVIDACRNMPISFRRDGRGMAPMNAVTDTLIAFSTQPGEIASDSGLYARTLAAELVKPGTEIAIVFQRVQASVANATNRTQRPRYDNGLLTPLTVMAARTAAPPVVAASPAAPVSQSIDFETIFPDTNRGPGRCILREKKKWYRPRSDSVCDHAGEPDPASASKCFRKDGSSYTPQGGRCMEEFGRIGVEGVANPLRFDGVYWRTYQLVGSSATEFIRFYPDGRAAYGNTHNMDGKNSQTLQNAAAKISYEATRHKGSYQLSVFKSVYPHFFPSYVVGGLGDGDVEANGALRLQRGSSINRYSFMPVSFTQ